MNRTSPDPKPQLSAHTHLGTVTLAVADLKRAQDFYTQMLGLRVLKTDSKQLILGTTQRPLLILQEKANARRQPQRTTGLYHIAILLPTRADLALLIHHLAEAQYPMQGYADHLVSEAFYLEDPDGNGLELYHDRPRETWQWQGDQVVMDNRPIDFDSFFGTIGYATWTGIPDETVIGHVHLRVADVPASLAFYVDVVGFDVTSVWHSAGFVSACGYHHHLGMNTWHSAGAPPPPADSVGLVAYEVVVPETDSLATRLDAAGIAYTRDGATLITRDPSQNVIYFVTAGQA